MSLVRFRRQLIAAGLLMSASFAATAASEICYSTAQPFGAHAPPTNATIFVCPVLGAQTVPQLAAAGWQIVSIKPLTVAGNISEQLMLRRGALIHGNGFES